MAMKTILAAAAFATSALVAHNTLADPLARQRSVTPGEEVVAKKVRQRLEGMERALERGADFKAAESRFMGDVTANEGRIFLEAEFGIADNVDQPVFTGVDPQDIAHFESRSGDDPRSCDQVADYVASVQERAANNEDGLYGAAVKSAADFASFVTKGESFVRQHFAVRANLIRYMIRTREAMFAAAEMCAYTKEARANGVEVKPVEFVDIKAERIKP